MARNMSAWKAAKARWYQENKEMTRKRSRGLKIARRKYVTLTKVDKPCKDCKQVFHPHAMEYDHVRGEKNRSVSEMANSGFTIEKIDEEISKCDLVCANCHRIRTWRRAQEKRNEQE